MAFGVGETWLAASLGDFPLLISLWTLAGTVSIAIVFAAFAGYYPARRAPKLAPIAALRLQ